MKKYNNKKSFIVCVLFVAMVTLSCTLNKVNAGAGASTMLGADVALPHPALVPRPIALPAPPAIPTTVCPVPPVALPRVNYIKYNPEKGGIPCADRIHHDTRKAAKQSAEIDSRRGGGGGPDGKNGKTVMHDGKYGRHYHGLNRKGDTLPRHHYFPKSVTIAPGDTLCKIANKYGLNYKDLQSINGIKDPTKIRPGQVIKLG